MEIDNNIFTKITTYFGEAFAHTLPQRLAEYTARWKLTDLRLIEYFSVNVLFTCCSECYGDCVLKISGTDHEWFIGELRTLREYEGRGYVRVYESDEELGAMLLERVIPGTVLKAEQSLDVRLRAFADVWRGLYSGTVSEPSDTSQFRTYLQFITEAADKLYQRGSFPELRQLMGPAISLCRELYERSSRLTLIHADLHGDNLLLNSDGGYTIVDPHGALGDPIIDLGRFIANEYWDAPEDERENVTRHVVVYLSDALDVPIADAAAVFFIDLALGQCWDTEDSSEENGNVHADWVAFAKQLYDELH